MPVGVVVQTHILEVAQKALFVVRVEELLLADCKHGYPVFHYRKVTVSVFEAQRYRVLTRRYSAVVRSVHARVIAVVQLYAYLVPYRKLVSVLVLERFTVRHRYVSDLHLQLVQLPVVRYRYVLERYSA